MTGRLCCLGARPYGWPSWASAGGTASTAPPSPAPGSEHALPTAPVKWTGPNGELQGAWAQTANPRGGVLVIHANRGLNDWVRSVTGRLAGAGYSALAVDLLSEEGGRAAFIIEDQATAALGKVPNDRLNADVKSGVDELQRRLQDKKLAVTGFSFGAGSSGNCWHPASDGCRPRFRSMVRGRARSINRVTSTEQAAKDALDQAGMVNDLIVEPNADHSFFNDSDPQRYNGTASADAWQRTLGWFGRYLI